MPNHYVLTLTSTQTEIVDEILADLFTNILSTEGADGLARRVNDFGNKPGATINTSKVPAVLLTTLITALAHAIKEAGHSASRTIGKHTMADYGSLLNDLTSMY